MSTVGSAEKILKKKKRRGWRGKNSAQPEAAPPAAGSHAVCGGGAASSGRPRRRSCGSDTRSTPSVRPGTGPPWGMLRTAPRSARGGWGRAGPQGLRARLAPACPSLRSCLPPPHTTAAATHISAEMARVGCGDHPAAWTELPTSGCCWKTRSGCASGRPGRAGVAVAVPGGTRGCGQCPTGAVGERSSRNYEKGPAGAAGQTERRPRVGVPTAGPRGVPVPRRVSMGVGACPGEQRLLGTQLGLSSLPLQGGQKCSFLRSPELKSRHKRPSEVTFLAGTH